MAGALTRKVKYGVRRVTGFVRRTINCVTHPFKSVMYKLRGRKRVTTKTKKKHHY